MEEHEWSSGVADDRITDVLEALKGVLHGPVSVELPVEGPLRPEVKEPPIRKVIALHSPRGRSAVDGFLRVSNDVASKKCKPVSVVQAVHIGSIEAFADLGRLAAYAAQAGAVAVLAVCDTMSQARRVEAALADSPLVVKAITAADSGNRAVAFDFLVRLTLGEA